MRAVILNALLTVLFVSKAWGMTQNVSLVTTCEDTEAGAEVSDAVERTYVMSFQDTPEVYQVRPEEVQENLSITYKLQFTVDGRNVELVKTGPLSRMVNEFEDLQRMSTAGEASVKTRTAYTVRRVLENLSCEDQDVFDFRRMLESTFATSSFNYVATEGEEIIDVTFLRTREQMMTELLDQMEEVLRD